MALSLKILQRSSQSQHVKKTIAMLPSLFTFGNALFGFLSIISALEHRHLLAACLIFLASIMDGLDGRLARALNSVSYLGAELDSLCDVVSFCAAPAILLYSRYPYAGSYWWFAMLTVYLCAGLFRLARFNISYDANYFQGLATTMSACFLASIVLAHDWLSVTQLHPLVTLPGLALVLAMLSLLMVCKIPFFSPKKRKITAHLFMRGAAVIGLLLFIGYKASFPVYFLLLFAYVLSGPANFVICYARRKPFLKF